MRSSKGTESRQEKQNAFRSWQSETRGGMTHRLNYNQDNKLVSVPNFKYKTFVRANYA